MSKESKKTEIRVAVDADFLENLEKRLGVKKATDLTKTALTLLDWAAKEVAGGRQILSSTAEGKEVHRLVMPELSNANSMPNGFSIKQYRESVKRGGFGTSDNVKVNFTTKTKDRDTHFLDIEVPGHAKEDLQISMKNGKLIVRFVNKHPNTDLDDFQISLPQAFSMDPSCLDFGSLKATVNKGILSVTCKSKKIEKEENEVKIEIV